MNIDAASIANATVIYLYFHLKTCQTVANNGTGLKQLCWLLLDFLFGHFQSTFVTHQKNIYVKYMGGRINFRLQIQYILCLCIHLVFNFFLAYIYDKILQQRITQDTLQYNDRKLSFHVLTVHIKNIPLYLLQSLDLIQMARFV